MRSLESVEPGGMGSQSQPRYDGRAKVMGRAQYAADFPVRDVLYAFLVQSTIPSGTIVSVDAAAAEYAHGVQAVMTPFNAPRLPPEAATDALGRKLSLLQTPTVHYNGQPIAVVVATSLVEARYAASLLKIAYQQSPARLDFVGRLGEARAIRRPGREPADSSRGDLAASMARAAVVVDETYRTPIQNHNSMETHSTVAWWEGVTLNLYNSTQAIAREQQAVAGVLGIAARNVRIQCPYTGGGFGGKGTPWSHVVLAAMAAKMVGRPVKLALERSQMFGPVGSRPATVQRIRLGATAEGKLLGVQHDVVLHTSVMEDFLESSAVPSRSLYASESVVTTHRLVEMNLGVCNEMRAPGEASGMAAFESAIDELAIKLKMDPVELRMLNYAERDEGRELPYTSKNLRACYRVAAERFGWSRRNATPGQHVVGNEWVGYGMASCTRHAVRSAAQAMVRILPDGRALVASGTLELGTGTYTILADTAAAVLGLDRSQVEVRLGDSNLPAAPPSVGSQSAASVCPAVEKAALQARLQLFRLAIDDEKSPLHGLQPEELRMDGGRVYLGRDAERGLLVTELMARHGGAPIEAIESSEPGKERSAYAAQSFGAVFAEVGVDRDTCMVRVRRVVGSYDIGTLLNRTTGYNQLLGGVVWGISFALHEEAHIDPVYGRTVNEDFSEYHVPVNADIGEIDVSVLNIADPTFNSLGARGIGEISVTGVAAAIANAIYNATGKRVRQFPITPDKILSATSSI